MSRFMKVAIEAARDGIRNNDGGPFGACIIKDGDIIAVAHNTVLKDQDATCHAEMNAIRSACRKLRAFDLTGCSLYTTAEPCPMCLGAIYWARIGSVFTGVAPAVADSFGFKDNLIYDEIKRPLRERKILFQQGVMLQECNGLFDEWKQLNRPLY